jgi:F-type H+-transporting ATPase subunit a
VAEPKKRGLFGLPSPVVIAIAVIFLAVLIIAFLVGPIGQGLFTSLFGSAPHFPSWLTVPQPTPHLPAPVLFHIGGWGVTNSMIGTWITVVFLVVISLVVTRRMKLVPNRLQGLFESLLGWIYDFVVGISGEENARKFFPVVCTIFLFVLFNAWLSLIPGFVSFQVKKYEPIPENAQVQTGTENPAEFVLIYEEGFMPESEVEPPPEIVMKDGEYYLLEEEELIRGANTDVNTPLAIAVFSVLWTLVMGVRFIGAGWFKQYFNFGPFFRAIGGLFKGKFNLMNVFTGLIDIFVGGLEFLSFWIRIISFTFRLFGNMTAGEILVLIISFLIPWVVAPIFYGLELVIGVVQALVFAGLTAVFVTMAVAPHEGGEPD